MTTELITLALAHVFGMPVLPRPDYTVKESMHAYMVRDISTFLVLGHLLAVLHLCKTIKLQVQFS